MREGLMLGLLLANGILIVLIVFGFIKLRSMYRAYDRFMRGRTGEKLEDTVIGLIQEVETLKNEDRQNKDAIRMLNKNQRASYQKLGIVKYNAFKGMGGNLSFACALLDYTNSGFILNSVNSREGCYIYIKAVELGQTDVLLGEEEKRALEQALGYIEK